MKRKRSARHDQEQENPSSAKSFRSNVTGKLQTLFSGIVSELQNIPDIKREDVALIFDPKCKEANCTEISSSVNSAFPSLANSSDTTKVLQNFIDSAKSRISGLLSNKPEKQGSTRNNSLKNLQPPPPQSKTKTLSIDSLEFQINLKFQSLLFKAFDTKKLNYINEKQEITTSESIITEKDWQDLSQMLQDFSQSAKKKLRASLTKEKNGCFLNGPASNQSSSIKESRSSSTTQPSLVSQRKGHNKELQKPSTAQKNYSPYLTGDSSGLNERKTKQLKMDCSSESTSSSSFSSDTSLSSPRSDTSLRSPRSDTSLRSPSNDVSLSSPSSDTSLSSPTTRLSNPNSDSSSSTTSTSSSSPRNPFAEGCMLLLSDAEKCPTYVELHLSSESDIDEPENVYKPPNFLIKQSEYKNTGGSSKSLGHQSESEDEVIVLGEKSKTYQEVTLEEDDDGQVHESAVEKVLEKTQESKKDDDRQVHESVKEKVLEKQPKEEKEIEEHLFNCPICYKSFRVKSLLQFHIKMHAVDTLLYDTSTSSSEEKTHSEMLERLNKRAKKKRENTKINPKLSSIKKNYREKYKKHKNRKA